MVWGKKKPTEFDQAQDKQLQQLMSNQTQILKNQAVLIKNNNANIEEKKKLWQWINNHEPRLKSLESRMTANEQKDMEQAALFANLARSATQTEAAADE